MRTDHEGVKQAAEKQISGEESSAGAEARVVFTAFAAQVNSCPVTRPVELDERAASTKWIIIFQRRPQRAQEKLPAEAGSFGEAMYP
jgi:hypothetical protein